MTKLTQRRVGWRGSMPDATSREERARMRARFLSLAQLVGHLPLLGDDRIDLLRESKRNKLSVRWEAERPLVEQEGRTFHGQPDLTMVHFDGRAIEYREGKAVRFRSEEEDGVTAP